MFDSHLQFGILSYGCINKSKLSKIITLQKKAVRHVANKGFSSHTEPIFYKLGILKFEDLFRFNVVKFMHQYSTNKLPASFDGMFTIMRETEDRDSRDNYYNYKVCIPSTRLINSFPRVVFLPIWNGLSSEYQCIQSHKVFSKDCKTSFVDKYADFAGCDNLSCAECKSN